MLLFLFRHGHADPEAPRDSLRTLSLRGKREVRAVVYERREALSAVSQIVASPYTRAQQTADLVSEAFPSIPRSEEALLVPHGDPKDLLDALHHRYHHEQSDCLLCVGHQPLIGTLLDKLLGAEPGRYRMGTASLACLEAGVMAYGCFELKWLQHADEAMA